MKDCMRSEGGAYQRTEQRLSVKASPAKEGEDTQTMLSPRRPTSSSGLRSTRELRPMHRHNPLSRCRAGLRGRAVSTKKRDKKAMVSASEFSKMGVCERLVLFEARYGKRTTPCRRGAITRGRAEHDKFF